MPPSRVEALLAQNMPIGEHTSAFPAPQKQPAVASVYFNIISRKSVFLLCWDRTESHQTPSTSSWSEQPEAQVTGLLQVFASHRRWLELPGKDSTCSKLQEAGWATSSSSHLVSRAGWRCLRKTMRKCTALLDLLPGIEQGAVLSAQVTHQRPTLPSAAAPEMLRIMVTENGLKSKAWTGHWNDLDLARSH